MTFPLYVASGHLFRILTFFPLEKYAVCDRNLTPTLECLIHTQLQCQCAKHKPEIQEHVNAIGTMLIFLWVWFTSCGSPFCRSHRGENRGRLGATRSLVGGNQQQYFLLLPLTINRFTILVPHAAAAAPSPPFVERTSSRYYKVLYAINHKNASHWAPTPPAPHADTSYSHCLQWLKSGTHTRSPQTC
jgi:hypothetical protein